MLGLRCQKTWRLERSARSFIRYTIYSNMFILIWTLRSGHCHTSIQVMLIILRVLVKKCVRCWLFRGFATHHRGCQVRFFICVSEVPHWELVHSRRRSLIRCSHPLPTNILYIPRPGNQSKINTGVRNKVVVQDWGAGSYPSLLRQQLSTPAPLQSIFTSLRAISWTQL